MKVLNSELQVVTKYSGPMVRLCFTETMEVYTPSKLNAKKYGTIMLKQGSKTIDVITRKLVNNVKVVFQDFPLDEIDTAIAKGAFEDADNDIFLVGNVVLEQSFTPFYANQRCFINPETKTPLLVEGKKVYRHTFWDISGLMEDNMNFVNPYAIAAPGDSNRVSWQEIYSWPQDKFDAYWAAKGASGVAMRKDIEAANSEKIVEILVHREAIKKRPESQTIEEFEFELLVAEVQSKGFTKSAEVSNYIIKNKLGYKYKHISGELELENDDESWIFKGGISPQFYRQLCSRLKLHDKSTDTKVGGFKSEAELRASALI